MSKYSGNNKRHDGTLIQRTLRNVWRRLYWPDYACGWYFPALRRATAILSSRDHDWMITVSHPFIAHIIGVKLKRRFPGLRWLADIGDPFSLMEDPAPNNVRLYYRLNIRADRAVLEKADVATVTTDGTRDLYAGTFPLFRDKLVVVPPLLTLPAGSGGSPPHTNRGIVRLVYSGTLYRSLRSPLPLLMLFEKLTALTDLSLELHFYGAMNDCADIVRSFQSRLQNRIFAHGMVDRESIRAAMLGADVLVNLGNRSAAQTPSKVIEYGAMCRPILNLVSVDNDSSVGVLNGYPSVLTLLLRDGVVTPEQATNAASFVQQRPPVSSEHVARWLKPFTVERVMESYLSLLRSSARST